MGPIDEGIYKEVVRRDTEKTVNCPFFYETGKAIKCHDTCLCLVGVEGRHTYKCARIGEKCPDLLIAKRVIKPDPAEVESCVVFGGHSVFVLVWTAVWIVNYVCLPVAFCDIWVVGI